MQLEGVLILLKDLAFPEGSILLQREVVLKHIISVIFHEANMCLVEVLTEIFEDDIEDAIVVDAFILQKAVFLFSRCDHRPEFVVSLASLTSPLCIAPGVS